MSFCSSSCHCSINFFSLVHLLFYVTFDIRVIDDGIYNVPLKMVYQLPKLIFKHGTYNKWSVFGSEPYLMVAGSREPAFTTTHWYVIYASCWLHDILPGEPYFATFYHHDFQRAEANFGNFIVSAEYKSIWISMALKKDFCFCWKLAKYGNSTWRNTVLGFTLSFYLCTKSTYICVLSSPSRCRTNTFFSKAYFWILTTIKVSLWSVKYGTVSFSSNRMCRRSGVFQLSRGSQTFNMCHRCQVWRTWGNVSNSIGDFIWN